MWERKMKNKRIRKRTFVLFLAASVVFSSPPSMLMADELLFTDSDSSQNLFADDDISPTESSFIVDDGSSPTDSSFIIDDGSSSTASLFIGEEPAVSDRDPNLVIQMDAVHQSVLPAGEMIIDNSEVFGTEDIASPSFDYSPDMLLLNDENPDYDFYTGEAEMENLVAPVGGALAGYTLGSDLLSQFSPSQDKYRVNCYAYPEQGGIYFLNNGVLSFLDLNSGNSQHIYTFPSPSDYYHPGWSDQHEAWVFNKGTLYYAYSDKLVFFDLATRKELKTWTLQGCFSPDALGVDSSGRIYLAAYYDREEYADEYDYADEDEDEDDYDDPDTENVWGTPEENHLFEDLAVGELPKEENTDGIKFEEDFIFTDTEDASLSSPDDPADALDLPIPEPDNPADALDLPTPESVDPADALNLPIPESDDPAGVLDLPTLEPDSPADLEPVFTDPSVNEMNPEEVLWNISDDSVPASEEEKSVDISEDLFTAELVSSFIPEDGLFTDSPSEDMLITEPVQDGLIASDADEEMTGTFDSEEQMAERVDTDAEIIGITGLDAQDPGLFDSDAKMSGQTDLFDSQGVEASDQGGLKLASPSAAVGALEELPDSLESGDYIFLLSPEGKVLDSVKMSSPVFRFSGFLPGGIFFYVSEEDDYWLLQAGKIVDNQFKGGWKLEKLAESYSTTPYEHFTEVLSNRYVADCMGNLWDVGVNGASIAKPALVFITSRTYFGTTGEISLPTVRALFDKQNKNVISYACAGYLYQYKASTGKRTGYYKTKHPVIDLLWYGDTILAVEEEKGTFYLEKIWAEDFKTIKAQVINLNKTATFSTHTKYNVSARWLQAQIPNNIKIYRNSWSMKSYTPARFTDQMKNALVKYGNYLRWLGGLTEMKSAPDDVWEKEAKGALLLKAINKNANAIVLNHGPDRPSGMPTAFYKDAYDATSHSNIGGSIGYTENGSFFMNQLVRWMDDCGQTPGHRFTFLHRGGYQQSYGSIPATPHLHLQRAESLNNQANTPGTIVGLDNNEYAYPWPAPGYVPADSITPGSNVYWSINVNRDRINFSAAKPKITIKNLSTGKITNVSSSFGYYGYWGHTFYFNPPGDTSYAGKSYEVTITNMILPGYYPATLTYTVRFFKPSKGLSLEKTKATLYSAGSADIKTLQIHANLNGKTSGLKYRSSNTKVAVVSKSGIVTARKKGIAKITISGTSGGKTYKKECMITVKTPSLKVSASTLTIGAGEKKTITVTAVPKGTVKFTSSKPAVVSVTQKGVVKGLTKGSSIVTVSCNGLTKKVKVVVK